MSLADRAVSIYVPSDALERIDALAAELGVQRATWCRITILERLRDEDRRDRTVAS